MNNYNRKSLQVSLLTALSSIPIFAFSVIAKIFYIKIISVVLVRKCQKISFIDFLIGNLFLAIVIIYFFTGLSKDYNLKYILMELSSFVVTVSIIIITRIHKRNWNHIWEYDLMAITYKAAKVVIIFILFWGIINLPFGNTYFYNDWGANRLYMGMGAASLSIYSALTTAMLYEVYLRHKTSSLLFIFLIVSVSLCFASGGRTPLFAVFLIIILSSIKKLGFFKSLIIFIVFSGLIFYFGDGLLGRSGVDLGDISSLAAISSSGRFALWGSILKETSALGEGFGSGITFAVKAGAILGYSEDHPHSELIRSYSIFGVFGLILYLVIGTFLFINVLNSRNLGFATLFLISLTDNIFVYWHFLFIAFIPFLMSTNRKLGY